MRRVSGLVPTRMALPRPMRWTPSVLSIPPSGGELVPLAFEAGGRPADTTLAFVRGWGAACEEAERSEVVRYAWQQFSLLLQAGNADLILSAVG